MVCSKRDTVHKENKFVAYAFTNQNYISEYGIRVISIHVLVLYIVQWIGTIYMHGVIWGQSNFDHARLQCPSVFSHMACLITVGRSLELMGTMFQELFILLHALNHIERLPNCVYIIVIYYNILNHFVKLLNCVSKLVNLLYWSPQLVT